jgi:hypothetical protein
MWLYHQSEGSAGSVFVERLVLQGVEGGGSLGVVCPGGTFSSQDGSVDCTPCARGTFSHEGAVTCEPCPENQFQSLMGQSGCMLCPSVSTAAPGSSFCNFGCTFSNGRTSWDLSSIRNVLIGPVLSPLLSSPRTFLIQLCEPILRASVCNDTQGNLVQTHVCEVDPISGRGVSGGSSVSFGTTLEGELLVTFAGGSDVGCPAGQVRESSIVLQCSPDAGVLDLRAELAFADGPCRRFFRLPALQGCRACSSVFPASVSDTSANPDYSVVVSQCTNSIQNVT